MSKEKSEPNVFDVKRIAELIELMKEHDLSEVDLRQEEKRIRLRSGSDGVPMMAMPQAIAPAAPAAAPAAAAAASEAVEDDNAIYITSPTVGTFYSKPKPESETFVKVGDVVSPDTVV
jgi:acetyl-CoA carboxylase biotin carboxyl carrier protein